MAWVWGRGGRGREGGRPRHDSVTPLPEVWPRRPRCWEIGAGPWRPPLCGVMVVAVWLCGCGCVRWVLSWCLSVGHEASPLFSSWAAQ